MALNSAPYIITKRFELSCLFPFRFAQTIYLSPPISGTYLKYVEPITGIVNTYLVSESVEDISTAIASLTASSDYLLLLDEAALTITYIGEAIPLTTTAQAKWRIKVLETTGPDIAIKWADGSTSFDKVWDDRATYTYE